MYKHTGQVIVNTKLHYNYYLLKKFSNNNRLKDDNDDNYELD